MEEGKRVKLGIIYALVSIPIYLLFKEQVEAIFEGMAWFCLEKPLELVEYDISPILDRLVEFLPVVGYVLGFIIAIASIILRLLLLVLGGILGLVFIALYYSSRYKVFVFLVPFIVFSIYAISIYASGIIPYLTKRIGNLSVNSASFLVLIGDIFSPGEMNRDVRLRFKRGLSILAIIMVVIGLLGLAVGSCVRERRRSLYGGKENISLTVSANKPWTDTGLLLGKGNWVVIEAEGEVTGCANSRDGAYKWVSPEGWGYSPRFYRGGKLGTAKNLLPNGSFMSLVGKIDEKGRPFYVGRELSFTVNRYGVLYLGVNDAITNDRRETIGEWHSWWKDNRGHFSVIIRKE